jgi:hypothetical protein
MEIHQIVALEQMPHIAMCHVPTTHWRRPPPSAERLDRPALGCAVRQDGDGGDVAAARSGAALQGQREAHAAAPSLPSLVSMSLPSCLL